MLFLIQLSSPLLKDCFVWPSERAYIFCNDMLSDAIRYPILWYNSWFSCQSFSVRNVRWILRQISSRDISFLSLSIWKKVKYGSRLPVGLFEIRSSIRSIRVWYLEFCLFVRKYHNEPLCNSFSILSHCSEISSCFSRLMNSPLSAKKNVKHIMNAVIMPIFLIILTHTCLSIVLIINMYNSN